MKTMSDSGHYRLPSNVKRDTSTYQSETIIWKHAKCPKCEEDCVFPCNSGETRNHTHLVKLDGSSCGGVLTV